MAKKQQQDLQASGLAQALLVEYLKSGHFTEHVRRSSLAYQRKLRRLKRALARELPELRFGEPVGGFSLWLESDLELDELRLLEEAVTARVSFDLGSPFLLEPSPKLSLRLCYSAVPLAHIDAGVGRLKRALARARRR